MSKIGKLPILIPEGVEIINDGGILKVKGPKGEMERHIPDDIEIKLEENKIKVLSKGKNELLLRKFLGTFRANAANMVKGVTEGWSKKLELVGVGFRGEVVDNKLTLALGFSHPVIFEAPSGISFKIEKNIITVEGIDKEMVGQISDKIRSAKPPEPYKGKGIKYSDEIVRRKAGKAAKTQGAAA